jgi:hypothetical protein
LFGTGLGETLDGLAGRFFMLGSMIGGTLGATLEMWLPRTIS